ncbi:MAG: efflux RND transporter periplasmic adaptor subunit [Isosphaeraceae bacterium]
MASHDDSPIVASDLSEELVRPPTRREKFLMVVKVIELRLRFIALMAGTGLVFGYWDTIWNHYEKWMRPAAVVQHDADTEYYCPMHPNVVRDAPGSCPICGMPLSKRAKGASTPLPEGVTARVALTPFRIAQAGVRTAQVGYTPLKESLTTVGSIEFDERRLARIASRAKGMSRVEKLHVNFTGTPVKQGEPLAELYSPELYQAVQELILAEKRMHAPGSGSTATSRSLLGDPADLVRLGREKLERWGLTAAQIDAILAQGNASPRLPILAPLGGVVVKKNVVEGQYVAEGEAMFEVADLSHVWVQAQVYEDQFALVAVGQSVEATVEAYPGEVFQGRVAFIDPALNPQTRTVGVRYDLENPDGRLRPGMFATVTLQTPIAETPAFRNRIARAQVAPEGASSPSAQGICPVTTLKLGAMGEPVAVEVGGRKIWTCCGACTPKLQASPARYLARLAPAPRDAVLTVPESAVIDTGTRKIVYVETEPGIFEGREVVLGPRVGDVYPVLEGVHQGEAVAGSGAFLIDAETRLNPQSESKNHVHEPSSPAKASEPDPKKSAGREAGTHRTARVTEGAARTR